MNVSYKCACMAAEATIAVADRTDDQDVVFWVEQVVGSALSRDHSNRSPSCRETKTEYIKIEIDRAGASIGKVTRQ